MKTDVKKQMDAENPEAVLSEIEAQQKRAAESRWAGMTKAERAAEMSRVRQLGVTRAKTKARALRQNEKLTQDARP